MNHLGLIDDDKNKLTSYNYTTSGINSFAPKMQKSMTYSNPLNDDNKFAYLKQSLSNPDTQQMNNEQIIIRFGFTMILNNNNNNNINDISLKDYIINNNKDAIKNIISKCLQINLIQIIAYDIEYFDTNTDNKKKESFYINGKISTNTWDEMILNRCLSTLVSQHVLSNALKNELNLDDNPRIARYYYKRNIIQKNHQINKSLSESINFTHTHNISHQQHNIIPTNTNQTIKTIKKPKKNNKHNKRNNIKSKRIHTENKNGEQTDTSDDELEEQFYNEKDKCGYCDGDMCLIM